MMIRVIVLCLILSFCAVDVEASLHDHQAAQRVLLHDLVGIRDSRYPRGQVRSRFPKPEKRLKIFPKSRRDPLSAGSLRPEAIVYTVRPHDSLGKIARDFGTTVELIKELNGMTGSRLRIGQKIWVWNQPFTIEINKTFNRLYFKAGDAVIKEYPVSTGRSGAQTPVGIFYIQSRYPNPTWFHKGTIVPGGAPENFLGSRWLGFDKPQYGIHGTIFPELIGQSVSSGCIRMKNEDIEELYEFIPVGTMVMITE